MGITERLDTLRAEFPACRSVTFADLGSGLVLCSSTAKRMPQERLDALCERARRVLDGPTGTAAADLLGGAPDQATLRDAEGLLVFVRSPVEPGEAFCCECESDIDVAAFAARALTDLAEIGAAQ